MRTIFASLLLSIVIFAACIASAQQDKDDNNNLFFGNNNAVAVGVSDIEGKQLARYNSTSKVGPNQIVLLCNDALSDKRDNCFRNRRGNFYADCDIENNRVKIFNCSDPHCMGSCDLIQTLNKDSAVNSPALQDTEKEQKEKQGQQQQRRANPKFSFTGRFYNASGPGLTGIVAKMDYQNATKPEDTILKIDNCSREELVRVNFIASAPHICLPPPPTREQQKRPNASGMTEPPAPASSSNDTDNGGQPLFWTSVQCLEDGNVRVESFDKEGCKDGDIVHNVTFVNDTCVNATRGPANLTRFVCRRARNNSEQIVAVFAVEFARDDDNNAAGKIETFMIAVFCNILLIVASFLLF